MYIGDQDQEQNVSVKVNWEGSLFVHHSLGMVNREILRELAADTRFDVRHVAYESDQFSPSTMAKFRPLQSLVNSPHRDAVVHVRHRWPPDLTAVPAGVYVLFQPWEYGCLPVEWVEKIPRTVREVWVYTTYLKECYAVSGIDEHIIHVIPLGIDPDEFRPGAPQAPWLREKIGKRFSFFFNGGVTMRKGVDILVNAYLSEFTAREPVCLVIKGSNAYTRELAAKVEALAGRSDIASIIYYTEDVPPAGLPGLYTACDCYVHPYRSEGYGLPVAEAMACGLPVIVTGAGACSDFVNEDSGYLIKCSLEKLQTWSVSGMKTVGNPFWLLPDTEDLRNLLRYVYKNRDEAQKRGLRASDMVRKNHTWKHTARTVADRLLAVAR
ncbi:MAG: glycosyltransferase [Chitinispirillaceae bacterium]|nr:glycosyltransferase [Chitinispirillaceae bacterium]